MKNRFINLGFSIVIEKLMRGEKKIIIKIGIYDLRLDIKIKWKDKFVYLFRVV